MNELTRALQSLPAIAPPRDLYPEIQRSVRRRRRLRLAAAVTTLFAFLLCAAVVFLLIAGA